ncbi:MAG: DUF805 domain-containing protein [Muribaculaceae bacterium]|nr:DUF805 domain-containing protein [Muribaculaceae bacterium]
MAIIEQCNQCGRSLGSCPYFIQEEVNPCQNYLKPIDNSGFFSHFLSPRGRIGRIQYLVTTLVAIVFCVVLYFIISALVGPSAFQNNAELILLFCLIPTVALIILAGIKRCHDFGEDWQFAMTGFIHMYCKDGDEGVNAFGTEPLKPYEEQIVWQQET